MNTTHNSKEVLIKSEILIPAKAGIHAFNQLLDPRFRGDDLISASLNATDRLWRPLIIDVRVLIYGTRYFTQSRV
jgi:hypothetical protein